MKQQSVFGKLLAIAILFIAGIGFVVSGVSQMIKKGNDVDLEELLSDDIEKGMYVDGEVFFATEEYLSIEHTVNSIPIGTDHFYFVFNKDLDVCISYRGDKEWFDNFNSYGMSEDGVEIKGLIKKMDSEAESEIDSAMRILGGTVDTSYYYIDGYTDLYINLQLIAGALFILMGLGYTWYQKNGGTNSVIAKIGSVFFVIILLLVYYIIAMN